MKNGFSVGLMNKPKFLQYCVIALNSAAVVWGLAAILWVVFPGPSGEWAGIAVFAAGIVNIPVGLIALAVGLIIRSGSDRLRRVGVISSIVVLLLPGIASLLWDHRVWLASVVRSFH
jgi:hypothetical protein